MLHHRAIPSGALEVLMRIMGSPGCQAFDLGGGTALALRIGHRISIDLDLFATEAFQPDELLESLPPCRSRAVLGTGRHSLNLREDGVKVDFLRHAYPRLETTETLEGIRLLAIPDIAAMKLAAATNRGARKDFYDLATLLEFHDLPTMLDWYVRKFPGFDVFPVLKSLTWFADAELEPEPVMLTSLSWSETKRRLTEATLTL